jgi:hypothetical protein
MTHDRRPGSMRGPYGAALMASCEGLMSQEDGLTHYPKGMPRLASHHKGAWNLAGQVRSRLGALDVQRGAT